MMTPETRILLVEDEEAHAELIRRAFEDESEVHVTHAGSLAVARQTMVEATSPFDLVVTDLRLPDGLGTQLLPVSDEEMHAPVIVMTSQGDERSAVAAMKSGAKDYVVKSETTFADLPRISKRVLREAALVQEKNQLKESLRKRDRLATIGIAASVLAHEIGNPLNSMSLHAELLKRRLNKLGVLESGVAESLGACQSEILRLNELLQSFRGLSKEQKLSITEVDLAVFLDAIEVLCRPMTHDARIDFKCLRADDLGRTKFDSNKITQVLLNLVKNATEAMSSGEVLTFETIRNAGAIEFRVSDTGCGIPDDIDIFEPFQSTKELGSGLGLPIVQEIVLAHRGSISCAPNSPKGTVVTVILPSAGSAIEA